MDTVLQDLRHALRSLTKRPALATAIVLTIGLGLGAAAAIFTASDAALVEPLPYAEPERLVHLWEVRAGTEERSPTSYPTLSDWRSRVKSFSALEGYDPTNVTVGVGDEARALRGARVTPGFFRLLGVRMSAGRDFLRDEDATTGAGVAIVTERFARSVAGGRALDQSIVINGSPQVVVGVLPDAFHFALLQNADVYVPITAGEQATADRAQRVIHVIGRLQRHVPLTGARAELSATMSELASEHAEALAGRTVVAVPLREALLGNMKPILTGLLIAVTLLLVTMGANLGLLMLTRYVERTPELAMRSALGATRARLLRQLLVESLVSGLAGAALALGLGHTTTRGLLAAIPDSVRISMPYLTNAGLNGTVIALIVGVATLLAIAFGLGPATTRGLLAAIPDSVRISMPYLTNAGLNGTVIALIVGVATLLAIAFGLGPALVITKAPGRAHDVRTTLARGDRRLRRGLVSAQLAVTVVLLVSAGLLGMSFRNLVQRDVGFRDPERLVTARVPLSGPRYQAPVAQRQFYEALLGRIAALPGVRGAGLINEAAPRGTKDRRRRVLLDHGNPGRRGTRLRRARPQRCAHRRRRERQLRETARQRWRDAGPETAVGRHRADRVGSGGGRRRRPGRRARCGLPARCLCVAPPGGGEPHDAGGPDADRRRIDREPTARDCEGVGCRSSGVLGHHASATDERVEGSIQSPVSYDLVWRIRRGRAGTRARGALRHMHARGPDTASRIRDSPRVGRIAELDPALDPR
ncbi:MAG: hypothetical protein DMD34_02650 [Gemmatimonadetes bacterium]|nr:MAG: hypothetical protein DMD34_02650 [Gemmatimonadota bacterium]